MRNFVPLPTSRHCTGTVSVPPNLAHSEFVFVRRGTKSTLQAPYEGPFKVLVHGDKTFSIDYGGRPETISVDRLKPAHLDLNHPVHVAKVP